MVREVDAVHVTRHPTLVNIDVKVDGDKLLNHVIVNNVPRCQMSEKKSTKKLLLLCSEQAAEVVRTPWCDIIVCFQITIKPGVNRAQRRSIVKRRKVGRREKRSSPSGTSAAQLHNQALILNRIMVLRLASMMLWSGVVFVADGGRSSGESGMRLVVGHLKNWSSPSPRGDRQEPEEPGKVLREDSDRR